MTPRATARLFVALDLPTAARVEFAQWARHAAATARHTGGRLRLLAPASLHLTVCFLGDRPTAEIDALAQALGGASTLPVGTLSVGAPLWLPPRRPRALAVELHDDAEQSLHALHDALARELAVICAPAPGDAAASAPASGRRHRFRPHVTVARMRAGEAPAERGLPATPALSFVPPSVTLYRSRLTPAEAVYEELATQHLPSGA
jgi:2'-5' RNA ligase